MTTEPQTQPLTPRRSLNLPRPGATARAWLTNQPLFLDTETTGVSGSDQICEIAIIDQQGTILLNTLVKPSKLISIDLTRIHGISNEMVAHAPSFVSLATTLSRLLDKRHLIAYNAPFDLRLIRQSAHINEVFLGLDCHWHCAMKLYSEFRQQPGPQPYRQAFQSLADATLHLGIHKPTVEHRALPDAELVRQLVLNIAQY